MKKTSNPNIEIGRQQYNELRNLGSVQVVHGMAGFLKALAKYDFTNIAYSFLEPNTPTRLD